MNKLEEAQKAFLKVRDYFLETQEDFALAKAYSKPWKWYREHTTDEAIEILRILLRFSQIFFETFL